MWCAYAFALFDLVSLPDAIRGGRAAIVSWVAQTFLQLVLLSVGRRISEEDERRELFGLEADLIAACRRLYGHSPACQFHGRLLEVNAASATHRRSAPSPASPATPCAWFGSPLPSHK
jgi:hypothetical protein